jgi:hypothetical protein
VAIVTLQNLIDRIRQRADQVTSGFVTDAEIANLANVAKRELDDLLVKAYGEDYYASSTTFSATANTATYSLSALTSGTFYKLIGLDMQDTSSPTGWRDVKRFNFHDRNRPSVMSGMLTVSQANGDVRYRLMGGNLSLSPKPTSTINMQLWWIPSQTALSLTSDTFDDINGWSELIVVDAAIAIKDKEESDTGVLQADRARIVQRIEEMTKSRDAGEPQTVADVQKSDPFYTIFPWR